MQTATAVLFDIDGTLLDMKGAGRRAFVLSIKDIFGWDDDLSYINFAGNTDWNVLKQVMAAHGTDLTPDNLNRFFQVMPIRLEREAQNAQLILYPGVRELLETLAADERIVLGLVTGNIESCARIKLRQFDLHGHFVLGGFGDRHSDRGDIAQYALQQVREHIGPERELGPLFMIGDTPLDVAAARHIHATAIAVATGKFGRADLEKCGADHVLTDLSDTQNVLGLLGLRRVQDSGFSMNTEP